MSNNTRYLIFGATGVLGSRLHEKLPNRLVVGTHFCHSHPDTVFCDLRDETIVREVITRSKPDVIIHAAGMTRPDACQADPALAWQVNVDGIRHVAAEATKAKIVFFSTDYVFDGECGLYTEEDPPSPINVYGESKLAAEHELLAKIPDALVLRTAGLLGWSKTNQEFLDQFITGQGLACSVDHVSSYTFIDDVVRFLPELLEQSGVIHFVGPDVLTRENFARLACAVLRIPTKVRGVPGTTAYPGAPRPRDSSLRSVRFRKGLTPASDALRLLATGFPQSLNRKTSPNDTQELL